MAPDRLPAFRRELEAAALQDGKLTAGIQSGKVKENLQADAADPTVRRLADEVLRSLEQNPLFLSAALPRHVFPPIFSRYDVGMKFGAHVDNAIRQYPGTANRLRTDLSATLFLSDPDEYDGGELMIEDSYGTHAVKLPAGHMVLYPSTSLHLVTEITRGARIASVFWLQSMVKDMGERALLFDLDQSIQSLTPANASDPALVRLTATYHNLLRRWAEL
ncbi:MAG TPA: Fe2+-dependent dioxygenase [Magnetospirillaceae bacterium]|nr:Fe2+-dependent dioxygenase [Magnetospirillaceae bacterium]